jgi:hypothetical protein
MPQHQAFQSCKAYRLSYVEFDWSPIIVRDGAGQVVFAASQLSSGQRAGRTCAVMLRCNHTGSSIVESEALPGHARQSG